MERCDNWFTSPKEVKDDSVLDIRIINKRTKEDLGTRLKRIRHVHHPFIVPCVVQGCQKHFTNEDKLKNHLIKDHGCSTLMTNYLDIYGLSQLYDKNIIWWFDDGTQKALTIDNYW
jgi:hypothetical protein